MAWRFEPTQEYLQKYSELYTAMNESNGMRLIEITNHLGLKQGGGNINIIATLESLDMPVWYEPETKKYKVMKFEDELMEVVR